MKKHVKKTVLGVAASVLTVIGFTTQAVAADPIKIGFVGGISGPCGPLVASELNAVKMGVEELNAAGGLLGRQIELVVRDGKTSPSESAKVARSLAVNDKVDVLTGVCSSSVMLSVSAVSKEVGTAFYSTIGSTQKGNIEAFHPLFWQTQANATMEAIAAAKYFAQKTEWKKILPMGFDYEWGHTSVKAFTETLKDLRPDVEIADPIFPKIGEKNMLPYVTAALGSQPDAIYAAVFGGGLVSLIKQGDSIDVFDKTGLVTLMTVDTLQSMGKAMPKKGIYGISRAPFYALGENEKAAKFIESYKEKFGSYPTDWAISGYDGLMFYAAAVKAAGVAKGEKLIQDGVWKVQYNGLRNAKATVRAFDGQMNAPAYVGEVTHSENYEFPIMHKLERYDGETLMFPEETIAHMRKAAE
jgi:branched-chain amino acid transport system substrate-binding protein